MQIATNSLACLEVGSTALGYQLLNLLTKSGIVKILEASNVDAGRFTILAEGSSQVLADALKAVRANGDATDADGVLDQELVESPHKDLLPAIYSLQQAKLDEVLVVVETHTASGLIAVAQALLEHHQVQVIELKVGRGVRGRGLGYFTGKIANASAGAEDARTRLRAAVREGRVEVIDSPTPSFRGFFEISGS